MDTMIDLTVIIITIWSLVLGIRRGLVVQLCHLAGLYIAIVAASRYAPTVGGIFLDDPGKATTAGFALIVAAAMLAVWIIAPLLRSIVVWRPVRQIDALLGGAAGVVTALLVVGTLFSVFDRANLDPTSISTETIRNNPDAVRRYIETGDADGHEIFAHKWVDYPTLESSLTFYPLVRFSDAVCPSLRSIDMQLREAAESYFEQYVDGRMPSAATDDNGER